MLRFARGKPLHNEDAGKASDLLLAMESVYKGAEETLVRKQVIPSWYSAEGIRRWSRGVFLDWSSIDFDLINSGRQIRDAIVDRCDMQ
jgi:hypothetical protein